MLTLDGLPLPLSPSPSGTIAHSGFTRDAPFGYSLMGHSVTMGDDLRLEIFRTSGFDPGTLLGLGFVVTMTTDDRRRSPNRLPCSSSAPASRWRVCGGGGD